MGAPAWYILFIPEVGCQSTELRLIIALTGPLNHLFTFMSLHCPSIHLFTFVSCHWRAEVIEVWHSNEPSFSVILSSYISFKFSQLPLQQPVLHSCYWFWTMPVSKLYMLFSDETNFPYLLGFAKIFVINLFLSFTSSMLTNKSFICLAYINFHMRFRFSSWNLSLTILILSPVLFSLWITLSILLSLWLNCHEKLF